MIVCRNNRGFTLIELMIVVAIIGILAAVATPMYLDYTARSQITEGINLTGAVKVAIAEFYSENGAFPAKLDTEIQGRYVSSVNAIGPVITVKYGNLAKGTISGQTITLTATDNTGSLGWACTSAIKDNLLPSACR